MLSQQMAAFPPPPLDVKGEALSVIKMSTKSGEKEFVCLLFTFKLQLALCKPAAALATRTRSIWSLLQLKNNVHVFSCAHAFDLDWANLRKRLSRAPLCVYECANKGGFLKKILFDLDLYRPEESVLYYTRN